MRKVFNYRRVFRIPYSFRRFGNFIEFNFDIPATFLANLTVAFLVMLFFWTKIIQKIIPHGFTMWDSILLIGFPISVAFIIQKVNPDGKNIYRFLWGFISYLLFIKFPKNEYCHDEKLAHVEEKVHFSLLYKVKNRGGKKNGNTNTHEGNSE
ncbi:hypothetical protein BLI29_03120 [Listeria monocytogenes]|uniref:TcpE family conjugal transfer membrane protein n=1 Tax=Listeria ivanovii TaxID=1638 RepID=UPI00183728D0|nr:TcpE family conjugal transfer membrane protein [Listeria ivanovii]EAG7617636.1 hypothetical protein [Listeria monocytogenes]EEO3273137.1 hypothetical protein [Listeria monocytogenes]MBM5607437.1 hypothetical protein [Listeria ivanovii]MBM5707657.1 hypothetical protein [Listeria ivanovii]